MGFGLHRGTERKKEKNLKKEKVTTLVPLPSWSSKFAL